MDEAHPPPALRPSAFRRSAGNGDATRGFVTFINCDLKNVPQWDANVLRWDADGAMLRSHFVNGGVCVVATDQRSRLRGMVACQLVLSAFSVLGVTTPVAAADLALDAPKTTLTRQIDLRVLKQDLPQVLQGFAEQAGVRVTLGKGLTKSVTNLHLTGTAAAALDTLSEHVGAVWWWSGAEIRMVDRTDFVTRTLKTRDIEQTLSAARSLGVPVDLISTAKADVPGIVRITGPSGLVAELETLAKDVAEQDNKVHVTRYGRRRISALR